MPCLSPYIVEHLVDLYFTSIPLGDKILHRPTFLQCLRSLPTSNAYLSISHLHALGATTSFVSPLIELPAAPDLSIQKVGEIFVPPSVPDKAHRLASGGCITYSLEQAVSVMCFLVALAVNLSLGRFASLSFNFQMTQFS